MILEEEIDNSNYLHIDTTSMSVHGEYDNSSTVKLTRGNSKDKRDDLNQFMISMVTSRNIPTFIKVVDGNTSDRTHFRKSDTKIKRFEKKKGRFILATNKMDEDAVVILSAYKYQQHVERGFRFLKDSMFFTDSIFIKNNVRIMSIIMLMGALINDLFIT